MKRVCSLVTVALAVVAMGGLFLEHPVQAQEGAMTLQLVDIFPFAPGVTCPPPPPGTFLFFFESSGVQDPSGSPLGEATHCHYLVLDSVIFEPYPQRSQIAYGTFFLADGTIEVIEYINVRSVPGRPGLPVFQVTGDITGGTGAYEDATGWLNGGGPMEFDDLNGLHLGFPFVLHFDN